MFTITDSAVEKFKESAKTSENSSLLLRISAEKSEEKGIVYKMGFDNSRTDDIFCTISGLRILVDPQSMENAKAMVIDYRQFEGQEQFVFLNPNDTSDINSASRSEQSPGTVKTCPMMGNQNGQT